MNAECVEENVLEELLKLLKLEKIEENIQVFVNSRPNDNPGAYQLFFENDSRPSRPQ